MMSTILIRASSVATLVLLVFVLLLPTPAAAEKSFSFESRGANTQLRLSRTPRIMYPSPSHNVTGCTSHPSRKSHKLTEVLNG